MLMQAVDTYLAVRRTVGFALVPIESYLRSFARFATARGDTHVVTTTAIDWASLAPSEAQRHYRLQTVVRFARFMAAEDSQHPAVLGEWAVIQRNGSSPIGCRFLREV
jgi:hypothetical protein